MHSRWVVSGTPPFVCTTTALLARRGESSSRMGACARCSMIAALLVALLLAAGPASGSGSRRLLEPAVGPATVTPAAAAPALHPVPLEFIVTNATLGSFLKRVASPNEQAVIFTTTRCAVLLWAVLRCSCWHMAHTPQAAPLFARRLLTLQCCC